MLEQTCFDGESFTFRTVRNSFIADELDADFTSSWHSGNPVMLSRRNGKNAESRCEKKRV